MHFEPEVPQRHIGGLRGFKRIFLIDLLTCGVQSTLIAMFDSVPLFRVFNEESNITQRLSEFFCGILFSDLFS